MFSRGALRIFISILTGTDSEGSSKLAMRLEHLYLIFTSFNNTHTKNITITDLNSRYVYIVLSKS
ncbi:response regulator [Wolbachia endosymbiont of Onchocerca ochengi]|nr:response regulator [Wolbachia endosymbiont of Onchocerca ochengi]